MSTRSSNRREFMKSVGMGAAALAIVPGQPERETATLLVDPKPRFDLSPYLYMQFMEPLGTTDGSVAAAWDFFRDRWREDVIETTRKLAPSLMRWGGCFISYYRWKEAVGPRDQRKPMLNLCWGGVDTNQVGTVEFVDFCRRTDAEPLMCVNLESDGKDYFAKTPKGDDRLGTAEEAAQWVSYCNAPDDRLRREHGSEKPHTIRLWQLGNETSYGSSFDAETAAKKSVKFAKAMRKVDPKIELIGWGDSGWARKVLDIAGEHLQYLAFHHMFNPDHNVPDSPLRGVEYRKDPARTWEHLMNAYKVHEARVRRACEEIADYSMPLALTECHFALPGRNRCEVLSTWAAGVANARLLNVHERYGERLKIATLADFCGTRWQVNALMIPVPGGKSFLMPVGIVMSLYRQHTGEKAVGVERVPEGLDVTASRTGNRVYLHVVNTNRDRSVTAALGVRGLKIGTGRVFELAGNPEYEVIAMQPDGVVPVEKGLPKDSRWTFPAASVSAVELEVAEASAAVG